MQPICQVQGLVLAHGKVGFENNPEKLEKAGFPHMQTQACTRILIQERLSMSMRVRRSL